MPFRDAVIGFVIAIGASIVLAAESPLELVAEIPLPNVRGRIDHLAVDLKGHRLFVAALGNNTVEVLDVESNRHLKSISGFGEPQGLSYLPEGNRLYVANGDAARVDILDGTSFTTLKRVTGLDDADNVRYDSARQSVIVGYGRGALRIFNAATGESAGDIALGGHPESFQVAAAVGRVYVNVPTAHHVAVVDLVKHSVIATWTVAGAQRNFPMALDERGKRLFVGTRSPPTMLTYDMDSGNIVAKQLIGGDTDDIFFDAERKKVYVICGQGRLDVFSADDRGGYSNPVSISTAPGARTGLFVPEYGKVFVAAPADGNSAARVLVYQLR
jgi:DNA-binding beta-propeller fold protein YncE